ncbi:hypothetical protein ACFFW8_11640 [Erwinia tracheiphila]
MQDLADAINDLSAEELDKYTGILEKATWAIGAAVAARYTWRAGKWGKDLLMGPGKKGAGRGELGGDGSVVPVYVTNWQDGGNGNGAGPGSDTPFNKVGPRASAMNSTIQIMGLLPTEDELNSGSNSCGRSNILMDASRNMPGFLPLLITGYRTGING